MTAYTVVLTPRAERQLTDLYAYIAVRSGVGRAENFVSRIVTDCMSLSTFPERGVRRDDIRPNLRIKGFDRRVTIAFSVDHISAMVAIHGVFYGGQAFELSLQEDDNND